MSKIIKENPYIPFPSNALSQNEFEACRHYGFEEGKKAQHDASDKENKEEKRKLIDAVDSMLDKMGLGQDNFPKSYWDYWQELKQQVEVALDKEMGSH